MADDQTEDMRARYYNLIDRNAVHAQVTEEVEADRDLSAMRRRLTEIFIARPDVDGIRLRADGQDIGIATRDLVVRDPGHAGAANSPFDPGSGEGATLPGHPSQFRAVEFLCAEEGCTVGGLSAFYDARFIPECHHHGPMKLRR